MTSTALETALARFPTVQVSALALREGNRKRPVYTMHKWWARRSGAVFRMIILSERRRKLRHSITDLWHKFYSASALPVGFTVLDPFLGGGTTLIEAAKQGADCIGVDIDPVACFVTELELARIDSKKIQARFEQILGEVETTLKPLYQTVHDGKTVDVVHYFWVDRVKCPDCGRDTDAHPTFQLAYDSAKQRQTIVCPECDAVAEKPLPETWHDCIECGTRSHLECAPVSFGKFSCPQCANGHPLHELCAKGLVAPRLFALEYVTAAGSRGFKRITDDDINLYHSASRLLTQQRSKLPLPNATIPSKGRADQRPLIYGIRKYSELFNDRQLLSLGLIARAIMKTTEVDVRRALTLAFSHCLASNNMLCGWAFGYRRLTPLFGVHSYRKVTRPVEGHILGLKAGRGSFSNAVRAVIRGCDYMKHPFEYRYETKRPSRVDVTLPSPTQRPNGSVTILNQSSVDLSPVGNGTVDLVLTDPPYFDNLSYSELSDFYHVWIRKLLGTDYIGKKQIHTPIKNSLFAGKRSKSKATTNPTKVFTSILTKVFGECHRVLRPQGSLVFTFHHKTETAWESLGTALLTSGFVIDEVVPVRSEGQSGFHSYEGSIKWDSIFFCRPQPLAILPLSSSHAAEAAARKACAASTTWKELIRLSPLEFSAADRSSLAMSLVLREFSRCNLATSYLASALATVNQIDRHEPPS